MTILVFIFISFLASVTLLIFNLYKSGLKSFHPPLFALCLVFPASFFFAFNIYPLGQNSPVWMKWFVAFSFAATWCIIDLIGGFNRHHSADGSDKTQKKTGWTLAWRIFLPVVGVTSFLVSDSSVGIFRGSEILVLDAGSMAVLFLQLFMQIYILYIIENTFLFANTHQRKIGHIFFISLIAITLFQSIFLTRSLLFKTMIFPYLAAYITITGICFPIALLGLLRVRVGSYEIGISRQSVYSSMSFFAFGAFSLAVGAVSFIARKLNLEFTFFEAFLFLFSALFFGILSLLSEDMRKRIRSFVNSHIFTRKFDYREQFFWLHQSYMASEDVDESIAILTAHLLYTLNYDKIFVFRMSNTDGDFHLHKVPKTSVEKSGVIAGDSPLVKEFLRDHSPLEFSAANPKQRESAILTVQGETIKSLGISAVFPIFHKDTLLGLLAVKYRGSKRLDVEDKTLISIFTVSIGNVFFKYTILKENIENKQFESFNRLAAFLVHDIKNQVATLSLVMRNADKNIGNPDFQKSLLISIQSCTNNLQRLVDKLASPPKSDQLQPKIEDVNAIVAETLSATGVSAFRDIIPTVALNASGRVTVDKESLFYILKNLIVNALEAMNNKGALSVATGDCDVYPEKLQKEFNISGHFLRKYRTYIFLEDSGVGMSTEFMDQRLFKPFSTTKDKGIGIGLYQCKILVEKMGGTLLCVSRVGGGTKFCILL